LETTLVVTPEDVLTEAFLLRSQWQGGKSKYRKGIVLDEIGKDNKKSSSTTRQRTHTTTARVNTGKG
jgi:hypothetical protein